MNYKITTLAENSVYGKGLQGEHGLSLLVEAGEHKMLFDTGASDLFLRNARLLGLDLSDVEYVVLSHGHRDHTGGLYAFLKMNSVAKVVCISRAFGWLTKLRRLCRAYLRFRTSRWWTGTTLTSNTSLRR